MNLHNEGAISLTAGLLKACATAARCSKFWSVVEVRRGAALSVNMIALVFTSVLAGLLALLLYQRITYPFLWADLIYYFKLQGYRKTLQARMRQGIITYLDCFLHQARKNPNKPFIIFEEQTLTYRDVDRRSNQFASALRTQGSVRQGDIVALWMFNEPDFICAWLGLCKLGCEVAFLNVNIKARSLLHCLQSCGAKTLVVGAGMARFPSRFSRSYFEVK